MAGVKRPLAAMLGHDESRGISVSGHQSQVYQMSANAASKSPSTWTPTERTPARTPNLTPGRSPEPATRTPSPRLTPFTNRIASFGSDATIVLAGIRGSGKSTLAVMAAAAMKRPVIDMESAFQQATGSSSAAYKKTLGGARCHEQQAKLLCETLERKSRGCIIVCSWMELSAQRLLRSFASTNPVVHVVRDLEAIQQHLRIQDREKMQNLLAVSNAIFRSCSNFEFFNISEKVSSASESHPSQAKRLPSPYLTLKGAERHFLKFLSQIYPQGSIPFIEAAFILATIPAEQRLFTYVLSVSMKDALDEGFDIEEHTPGADAVQIVVSPLPEPDALRSNSNLSFELASDITRAIASVRKSSVLPIIAHIALPEHSNDEMKALYISLVSHTFRSVPEMVTIDLRLDEPEVSSLLEAKGCSKVIGDFSFSGFDAPSWSSSFWATTYSRAVRLGFDMARFVRPASCLEDNFAVSRLRATIEIQEGHHIPLTAYNTGAIGRNSACFNPVLTVVECERADPTASNSLGLTARAASLALTGSFIYDPMKLYVFGGHVSYSMSPAMHNSALQATGMPHRYEPFSSNSLSGLRHLIEDPNFGGASVGLPFKVEIISLTHSLSRHAQAIGAVNTLIPVRDLDQNGCVPQGAKFVNTMNRAGPVKALYGENTDWIGIRACIRRGLSPANAVRKGTCGIIIGAGGMARAAAYAMLQVGVQNIAIYNRTVSRAEQFASHFHQLLQKEDFQSLGAGRDTRFRIMRSLNDPWPSDFNLPTMIISCIPTHRMGDAPAPDFRVPEEWLGSRTGGVIIELGYKTLDTPLLAQAKSRASQGWVALDGLDLLPDQGFAQFELFTGRRAPRRVMRRDLLRGYADAHGKQEREEMGPRLGSINEPEA